MENRILKITNKSNTNITDIYYRIQKNIKNDIWIDVDDFESQELCELEINKNFYPDIENIEIINCDNEVNIINSLHNLSLKNWSDEIENYIKIKFSLNTIKLAFIMDIGFRAGKDSKKLTDIKKDPFNFAFNSWKMIDENENETWIDSLNSWERDSLIDNCCILEYGLKYPKNGDSEEYKEEFLLKIQK